MVQRVHAYNGHGMHRSSTPPGFQMHRLVHRHDTLKAGSTCTQHDPIASPAPPGRALGKPALWCRWQLPAAEGRRQMDWRRPSKASSSASSLAPQCPVTSPAATLICGEGSPLPAELPPSHAATLLPPPTLPPPLVPLLTLPLSRSPKKPPLDVAQ